LLPQSLQPLATLTSLHTLSLSGICLLNDDAFVGLLDGSARRLTCLSLRGCSLLGPDAIVTMARLCPALQELDLEGLELLTDAAAIVLAVPRRGPNTWPRTEHVALDRTRGLGLNTWPRRHAPLAGLCGRLVWTPRSLQRLAHCTASLTATPRSLQRLPHCNASLIATPRSLQRLALEPRGTGGGSLSL
jgi:hypothetical protein